MYRGPSVASAAVAAQSTVQHHSADPSAAPACIRAADCNDASRDYR